MMIVDLTYAFVSFEVTGKTCAGNNAELKLILQSINDKVSMKYKLCLVFSAEQKLFY